MRVVITGATGNAGSALVAALAAEPSIDEVVGIARRPPPPGFPLTGFARLDLEVDDLLEIVARRCRRPSRVGDPAVERS